MRELIISSLIFLSIGLSLDSYSQSKSGYQLENAGSKKLRKIKPVKNATPFSSSVNQSSFVENLFFGFTPGLSFGQNYLYLSISPAIGYKPIEGLAIGTSFAYAYTNVFGVKFNNYGPDVFARYLFSDDKYFAAIKYEFINYAEFSVSNNQAVLVENRSWYNTIFLGGGFAYPLGDAGSFQLSILYNVNYNTAVDGANGPYTSPLIIEPGFFFSFY